MRLSCRLFSLDCSDNMETETRSWAKRKWTDFEGFVEGVIYDRDLSVSARLFGLFLHPFSYLFSAIVRLRLFLYSRRFLFKARPLDCLVLVVGNLTVGGTGKTPVVERFTKELMAKGKKVAILSRGYKSKEEPSPSIWRHIWRFSGRARRQDYWKFTLLSIIIAIVLRAGFGAINLEVGSMAYGIYLAILIPSIAVTVRRLHDINKSGWMILVSLIPFIGGIWLLILMCLEGTLGPNDYGEDPKAAWRKNEQASPKIVSDGERVLLDSEEAGDEPYMLAINLPGAVVLADKDRVKAGRFAIKEFQSDVLILDDGFQYLPIKGTLNLLLVDQTNPFGNRCLLPRGILREPVRHLSRASYVFLTKSEAEPELELLQTIRKYNRDAEIIRCVHKPKFFKEINGDEVKPLNLLHEAYVGVFCGIASPRGFEQLILRMSGELRFRRRFLDHHRYGEDELDRMFLQAKNAGADVMVTTEKDAVRIPATYKPLIPFYYVRMEIEVTEGFEDFEEAVAGICFPERVRDLNSISESGDSERGSVVA
jgi:tetraacyldisaccharide 4'-kinase